MKVKRRRKVIVETEPPLKVRIKRFLESSGLSVYLLYLLIVIVFLGVFMLILHIYWKQQYTIGGFGDVFNK